MSLTTQDKQEVLGSEYCLRVVLLWGEGTWGLVSWLSGLSPDRSPVTQSGILAACGGV